MCNFYASWWSLKFDLLSRGMGADHRCFAAHTWFCFNLNWVLRRCFSPRLLCNMQGNGWPAPQDKHMLWAGGDCMVKFIEKNLSNKVSICALDSTAVTFKELQRWKYMWGMYMDGYDGHANVCPYSLPPLIWCCGCTSWEEKIVMGNSFPHIFGENYHDSQSQQKGQQKLMAWRLIMPQVHNSFTQEY